MSSSTPMNNVHSAGSVAPDGTVRCYCGEQPRLLTSRTDRNPGRQFYSCDTCKFWKWLDDTLATAKRLKTESQTRATVDVVIEHDRAIPSSTPSTPSTVFSALPMIPPSSQALPSSTSTMQSQPQYQHNSPPSTPARPRKASPSVQRSHLLSPDAKAKRLAAIREAQKKLAEEDEGSSSDENAQFERDHTTNPTGDHTSAADMSMWKSYSHRATEGEPRTKKFRPSTPPNVPKTIQQSITGFLQGSSRSRAPITPPQSTTKRSKDDFDAYLNDSDDEFYMDVPDSPSPLFGKGQENGSRQSGKGKANGTKQSMTGGRWDASTSDLPHRSTSPPIDIDLPSTPQRAPKRLHSDPYSISTSLIAGVTQLTGATENIDAVVQVMKTVQDKVQQMERKLEVSEKSQRINTEKIDRLQLEIKQLKEENANLQRALHSAKR